MVKIFDGKSYALEKENLLTEKVRSLKGRGVVPKLVSIIIGSDPGSVLYQNLKKRAAERVGAALDIVNFDEHITMPDVLALIEKLNHDAFVHGIMIQLPLPGKYSKEDRDNLISAIASYKDVDGLKEDGDFITPVVRAVVDAIPVADPSLKVSVLGANGFEGRRIVKRLKDLNYTRVVELVRSDGKIKEILRDSDIIISATGQPDLVTGDMVKDGVVLIDVGSPKGDIEKGCYEKASFVTPVPGGIGPATIANLIENLVLSAEKLSGR